VAFERQTKPGMKLKRGSIIVGRGRNIPWVEEAIYDHLHEFSTSSHLSL